MVEQPRCVLGRYELHRAIASGGMAQVHLGRLRGGAGFSKIVAIKRMLPQLASDPQFASMFLQEARLAARVHHPNVIPMLDVVSVEAELLLVMEYVPGLSLARILELARRERAQVPLPILSAIMSGVARGLHAAHEATDAHGRSLRIVHRDVSPQNILVGTDGVPRLFDFGIAKAYGRGQVTREGEIKGKLSYMSPEQLRGGTTVDRRSDVFSAGVVFWELLAGDRLFVADDVGTIAHLILHAPIPDATTRRHGQGWQDHAAADELAAMDRVARHALERDESKRLGSAEELESAIARAVRPATASEVSRWLQEWGGAMLKARAALVADVDSAPSVHTLAVQPTSAYALAMRRADVVGGGARALAATESIPAMETSDRSMTATAVATEPRRSRLLAASLGLLALVVVFALAWLDGRLGSTRASAASREVQSTNVPALPPSGDVVAPLASAPPAASAPASVITAPPTTSHSGRPRSPAAPGRPSVSSSSASPTVAAPATSRGCRVAFTLGPDGEKIFRQECSP